MQVRQTAVAAELLLSPGAVRGFGTPVFRWCLAPALAAWLLLLLLSLRDGSGSICSVRALAGAPPLFDWLAQWLAMIAAMMLPLIVPMVRHVAVRSFAVRRERAVGAFVLGYLLIWLLVGLAMWLTLPALRHGLAYLGLADHGGLIACGLAALWQISPAKRRAVNRCHRTLPLHAVGFAADRDAMTFGLLHAGRCVAVCLPAMAAPLLGSAGLVGMLAVLAVLLAERARRAPQYRLSAVVLLLVGLIG